MHISNILKAFTKSKINKVVNKTWKTSIDIFFLKIKNLNWFIGKLSSINKIDINTKDKIKNFFE